MELLAIQKGPACNESSEGVCSCMLMSDDERYGIMYGGTTAGSRATLFISSNYCYDGDSGNLVRVCGDDEQWSGEMVEEDDVTEGKVESDSMFHFFTASLLQKKLTNLITILIVFGAFTFLIGLCGAFIVGICLYCRIKISGKIVCFNTSNSTVN